MINTPPPPLLRGGAKGWRGQRGKSKLVEGKGKISGGDGGKRVN